MTIKKALLSSEPTAVVGQTLITSTGTWTVPVGVTEISLMGVEPGQNGNAGSSGVTGSPGAGGSGGLGGNARYLNSLSVSAGQVLNVSISGTTFSVVDSISGNTLLSGVSGGVSIGRAGSGTSGGNGIGNSAGGGFGLGGLAVALSSPSILVNGPGAQGTNGSTVYAGGNGGNGEFPGGGGGGGGGGVIGREGGSGGVGGGGCVRIIWPGSSRAFPSTRIPDEVAGEFAWGLVANPSGLTQAQPAAGIANDGNGAVILLPPLGAIGTTLYRSTDNGKSFTPRATGIGSSVTMAGIVYVNGIFLVATSGGVLRSTDKGLTWTLVTVGVALTAIAAGGGVVMVGGNKSVYRSTNDGASFTAVSLTTAIVGQINGMAYGNSVFMIGDSSTYPQRSTNLGLNFTRLTGPTSIGASKPIFVNGLFYCIFDALPRIVTGDSTGSTFPAQEDVGTGGNFDLAYAGLRKLVLGVSSKLLEYKNGGSAWAIPSTLLNNLVDPGLSVYRFDTDGFGVVFIIGNYGLIMRGELK